MEFLNIRTDPTYAYNIVNNTRSAMDVHKIDFDMVMNVREYFRSVLTRMCKYKFLFNRYTEVIDG